MDANLTTVDTVLRLTLAFAAGALLGYNRGERGNTAGLRTTILVTLAAAAAMVAAFALLPIHADGVAGYTRMDVMRLPLGILTGIGFIGAGAIIRNGEMVRGVTTAATIWIATVIGLILGAGLFALGVGLTLLTFFVLWALKLIEPKMRREHRARLTLSLTADGPDDELIRERLAADDFQVAVWAVVHRDGGATRALDLDLVWKSRIDNSHPPLFLDELRSNPGVLEAAWRPNGATAANE